MIDNFDQITFWTTFGSAGMTGVIIFILMGYWSYVIRCGFPGKNATTLSGVTEKCTLSHSFLRTKERILSKTGSRRRHDEASSSVTNSIWRNGYISIYEYQIQTNAISRRSRYQRGIWWAGTRQICRNYSI